VSLPRFAYFQGRIVPYSEAKVGVMNHTLNYGTGAFGGIRGYWNAEEEQLFIFRLTDHFKRLMRSAQSILAETGLDVDDLRRLAVELVGREGYARTVTSVRWSTTPTRSSASGCTISIPTWRCSPCPSRSMLRTIPPPM
jgi:branched-subunit amino acid aminotransferase/4-amino-4-deoxychorismate lyase